MILQGRHGGPTGGGTPPGGHGTPSAPIRPPGSQPAHSHRPGHGTPPAKAHKPSAPQKPTPAKRPPTPHKKGHDSAPRYAPALDSSALVLIGLKLGAHIH